MARGGQGMSVRCLIVQFSLLLLSVVATDAPDVGKLCQDVRDNDEIVCQQIINPTIANREKVFTDIKTYISSLAPLYEALKIDKERAIEICNDVFKIGTSRYMNVKYDYDHLVAGFNWTDDDMNRYRDLRFDTLTEWVKMEPYIFD